jgi:hypothetical protein
MTALIIFMIWLSVYIVLKHRNHKANPLEHGAEDAMAFLWPVFLPFVAYMWIKDKLTDGS